MAMIGELATPHPIQVLPTTPVFEVARRMTELEIGDVIVTDDHNGAVVGLATDRDLVVRVLAPGLDPATTTVGDICTQPVTTITATEDVATAEKLMRDDAITRLPVVNNDGTLAGVVSITDLVASGYVADDELRDVLRSLVKARRHNRFRG
jgi:CBS domain-containing protein